MGDRFISHDAACGARAYRFAARHTLYRRSGHGCRSRRAQPLQLLRTRSGRQVPPGSLDSLLANVSGQRCQQSHASDAELTCPPRVNPVYLVKYGSGREVIMPRKRYSTKQQMTMTEVSSTRYSKHGFLRQDGNGCIIRLGRTARWDTGREQ